METISRREFLEKYTQAIRMKGYSEMTLKSYFSHLNLFLDFKNKISCKNLSSQDINDYLVYLNNKKVSESFFNQAVNAIRFFFKYILNKKIKDYLVVRPKKAKTKPIILSDEEIQKTFDVCDNKKHKAIIGLMYGSGLRVSEVVNLKIEDVDSKNMVIWIRQSKGKKDRMAILTDQTLFLLRDYFLECELPTHGRADGMGFKGHHFYHCRQFTLIFKSVFPTQIIFKSKRFYVTSSIYISV